MEKIKKTRFFEQNLDLCCALLIVVVFYFVALYCKHIYPFGIDYLINENDFRTQSVPIYMHMWDFFHGKSSLFFEWRIGLGSNFAGTLSHFSLLSPFSLFFLFVERADIPQSMTWFILLKLISMCFSMTVFLNNDSLLFRHRPSRLFVILGSAGYAINGYTMQYYGFPWMDVAVFIPPLFLFLDKLLTSHSYDVRLSDISYVILLTVVFVLNIPQAYAVCLLVLGYACGYLFIVLKDKNNRSICCIKLIILSLLALGLSMAFFLPAYLNIRNSYRMTFGNYGNGIQSYITMMDLAKQEVYRKNRIALSVSAPLLMMCFSSLPIKKGGETNRIRLFYLYIMFLTLAPVFFESVNGVFHNGPYSCYPMRYAYTNVFLIIAVGIASVSKSETFHSIRRVIVYLSSAIWVVSSVVCLSWIEGSSPYGYENVELADKSGPQHITRTRLMDASMIENYPLYMDVSALSNYVPLNSLDQVGFVQKTGYSQRWVALDDAGGTLFSDALMRENYKVESNVSASGIWKKNESDYSIIRHSFDNNLCRIYQSVYSYDPALFVPSSFDPDDKLTSENPFENQNRISNAVFSEELFTWETYDLLSTNKNVDIHCNGNEMVYFWSNTASEITISLNGEEVLIPDLNNPENTLYPTAYNNGIICLGSYKDQSLSLGVSLSEIENANASFVVGHLNLDTFIETFHRNQVVTKAMICEKAVIQADIECSEDGYIMMPIYSDPGWTGYINYKRIVPESLYGMFLLLPVKAGLNHINLVFVPQGVRAGILISVLSAVLLLSYILVSSKKDNKAILSKVAALSRKLVLAVWVGFLLYVYIIPIFFRTCMSLYKRFF